MKSIETINLPLKVLTKQDIFVKNTLVVLSLFKDSRVNICKIIANFKKTLSVINL